MDGWMAVQEWMSMDECMHGWMIAEELIDGWQQRYACNSIRQRTNACTERGQQSDDTKNGQIFKMDKHSKWTDTGHISTPDGHSRCMDTADGHS